MSKKEEKEEQKNRWGKQETNNKVVDLNTNKCQ